MSTTIAATARIQVTVEVTAGHWGADCNLEQIYRQAAVDAVKTVERLLGSEGRIVGEPRVTAVLVEQQR
jgi:hypothetical protein